MNTRDVFGRETVPVVTVAEAVTHDRYAQQQFAIPERALMENAGRALAAIIHTLYSTGTVVGVAGSGHNGGDTIIALRTLAAWGRDTALINASSRALDRQLLGGYDVPEIADGDVERNLAMASVIVDGVLGTGARGAPRDNAKLAINRINAAARPVIAVDLPSGVDAESGVIYDDAISATTTVAFGAAKRALLFQPARDRCGRLMVADIGFPPFESMSGQMITPGWASARFPVRPANANKGTSGRLLLLVGSKGMAGAAVIAAGAAVRSGAGLVRIASAQENREIIQKTVPEATFFDRDGTIDFGGITALVAGPGIGASDSTRTLLASVLARTAGIPTLLDADALNLFANNLDELTELAQARPLVITPHPKEMSRLTGHEVNDIVTAPWQHALDLAAQTGATVLLKGQPSIVAARERPMLFNAVGSSDFAVAGMGDQLAGVIGAMLAAGLDAMDAAGVGLYYSGRAGDIANLGRSLTPTDVTDHLARAFANPGATASSLGLPFITFDQPARW